MFGGVASAQNPGLPELTVELDDQELVFPRVAVPDAPVEDRITLANFGALPVTLGRPVVERSQAFSVDDSLCAGSPLEPDEQCELIVRFDPPSPGVHSGELVIHSDADFAPHSVFLEGTGSGSDLGFLSVTRFGRVALVGVPVQRLVRLQNRGPDPAAPTLQITGADAGAFRLYENQCTSVLTAGASCLIGIEFTAVRAGLHGARLEATAPSAPTPAFLELLVGTSPARPVLPRPVFPPAADVSPLLAKVLNVSARAWRGKPRHALRRRGFAADFVAPAPGTLRLELRRAGSLVARGTSQGGPGRVVVRALTTPFGRRLLRSRRALPLTARLVFAPMVGTRSRNVRAVRLPAVRR